MTLSEKIREEGIAIGEVKSLIKTTIRLLTKTFGGLFEDYNSGNFGYEKEILMN